MNFVIIDIAGKKLLRTKALEVYKNMYLVKNNNKKMVLLDNDLKQISNEYDKINTNMSISVSEYFSSY